MKLYILLAMFLTGCASTVQPVKENLTMPSTYSMLPCEPLPQIQGNTLQAVVNNQIDMIGLYRACRERHQYLIEYVQKIKDLK